MFKSLFSNDKKKKDIKHFEEIRFILLCFQVKYSPCKNLPMYGLPKKSTFFERIKDNWEEINKFLRYTNSWIVDTNFSLSLHSFLYQDSQVERYHSFLKDITDLHNQIKIRQNNQ